MLDLGFLALLTFGSAGVGIGLLRRLDPTPEHPSDALALAVPLGLGLLALAVLGLGELGLLNPWGLSALAALGLGFGAREAGRVFARRATLWAGLGRIILLNSNGSLFSLPHEGGGRTTGSAPADPRIRPLTALPRRGEGRTTGGSRGSAGRSRSNTSCPRSWSRPCSARS